jgi:hypothetical protein
MYYMRRLAASQKPLSKGGKAVSWEFHSIGADILMVTIDPLEWVKVDFKLHLNKY